MTARNAAKTISLAIKSTLKALPGNSELLILLDDCTDDSWGVASSIRDDRVRIIVAPEKLGINRSRNYLIGEARGEFIAVMDADDITLPWRFRTSLKHIKDADAIFGTAIVFGAKLRPLPILPQYPIALDSESAAMALAVANPFVHSSALIRSSTIKTLGGYSDSKSEDYELWLRMVNNNYKVKRMAIPTIAYRFHATQASQEQGFMKLVSAHPTLVQELALHRSKILNLFGVSEVWDAEGEGMVQKRLYSRVPAMKFEHKGLPDFLKKWKQKALDL